MVAEVWVEHNKKLYAPPPIETYHEEANESFPYALPNTSVLNRVQNDPEVCEGRIQSSSRSQDLTAELRGPYHISLVHNVIKSNGQQNEEYDDQQLTTCRHTRLPDTTVISCGHSRRTSP